MRVLKPLISISDNVYYNPLKYEGSKTIFDVAVLNRLHYNPMKYEGSKTIAPAGHFDDEYYNPLKYEGRYTHAVGGLCRRALRSNIKTGKFPGLLMKSGEFLRQMMS